MTAWHYTVTCAPTGVTLYFVPPSRCFIYRVNGYKRFHGAAYSVQRFSTTTPLPPTEHLTVPAGADQSATVEDRWASPATVSAAIQPWLEEECGGVLEAALIQPGFCELLQEIELLLASVATGDEDTFGEKKLRQGIFCFEQLTAPDFDQRYWSD